MADFIHKTADHPPAGSSPGKDAMAEQKNWGKYGSMHLDVTATGEATRILSESPDGINPARRPGGSKAP
jgi:hypothetical protein